jgi:voltage-gated potassium channel
MKRRLKSSRERSFNNLITGLSTLCGWVIVGTIGYRFLEKWTWFDSLYMTILSLSTVGFREAHNLSQSGRIFTLIPIVGRLSTAAYSLSVIGQWVFEGKIREALGRTRMRKELNNLRGHSIVCGYGRMGKVVTQLLREEGDPDGLNRLAESCAG